MNEISGRLLHAVLNRLQLVLGAMDLGEAETDQAKRKELFTRARREIRDLTNLLKANRRADRPGGSAVRRKKK